MAAEEGRGEGGHISAGVVLDVSTTGINGSDVSRLNGKALNGGSTTVNAVNDKIDRRPQRLSALGTLLSLTAFVLSVVAVSTSQWGRSNDFAVMAGGAAVLTSLLSLSAFVLSVCVLSMHRTETKVCLSFKKATVWRMVITALAGLFAFVSVILFVLFSLQGSSYTMAWGFYVEVLTMLVLWVAGAEAGAEWQKSRKLGGDPTRRGDPKGIHAHTISNPNFRDTASSVNETSKSPPTTNLSPLEVHRNGDVAMTQLSGQPYMLGVNGVNGHAVNGRSKQPVSGPKHSNRAILAKRNAAMNVRPVVNKTANNKIILNRTGSGRGRKGGAGVDDVIVAFDPSRTPARSSMRKPKTSAQVQQSSAPDNGSIGSASDTPDGGALDAGIPNPSFSQNSPPAKKKVRIHTQSTAV